jgi:hypothetical protein
LASGECRNIPARIRSRQPRQLCKKPGSFAAPLCVPPSGRADHCRSRVEERSPSDITAQSLTMFPPANQPPGIGAALRLLWFRHGHALTNFPKRELIDFGRRDLAHGVICLRRRHHQVSDSGSPNTSTTAGRGFSWPQINNTGILCNIRQRCVYYQSAPSIFPCIVRIITL